MGVLRIDSGVPAGLCAVYEGDNSLGPCLTARRIPITLNGSSFTIAFPETHEGDRGCLGFLTMDEFDAVDIAWEGCGDEASLTYPAGTVETYALRRPTATKLQACGY
ncbi:MAG: hypothetical protein OEZ06_21590 [Myxococcales bacterium]|nr:hypothetical protein [Myxococcales bacterium]